MGGGGGGGGMDGDDVADERCVGGGLESSRLTVPAGCALCTGTRRSLQHRRACAASHWVWPLGSGGSVWCQWGVGSCSVRGRRGCAFPPRRRSRCGSTRGWDTARATSNK